MGCLYAKFIFQIKVIFIEAFVTWLAGSVVQGKNFLIFIIRTKLRFIIILINRYLLGAEQKPCWAKRVFLNHTFSVSMDFKVKLWD